MACCTPEMPVWAIAAAPPAARSRFLGLAPDRAAARPSAPRGVVLPIVAIHFGICGSSPPWGRPRNWRTAISSSRIPRPILTQLTHVAGGPDLLAWPVPARARKMTPTMPRPSSQPRTNARPLTLARLLGSMRTTPMIGIGLSAIPTASGSDPPLACPITSPQLAGRNRLGRRWPLLLLLPPSTSLPILATAGNTAPHPRWVKTAASRRAPARTGRPGHGRGGGNPRRRLGLAVFRLAPRGPYLFCRGRRNVRRA